MNRYFIRAFHCLFQVVLVFILSIASLIIYFIDASRWVTRIPDAWLLKVSRKHLQNIWFFCAILEMLCRKVTLDNFFSRFNSIYGTIIANLIATILIALLVLLFLRPRPSHKRCWPNIRNLMLSCYSEEVERCQKWSNNITQQIDLAFNIFFMVYFFIRVSKIIHFIVFSFISLILTLKRSQIECQQCKHFI